MFNRKLLTTLITAAALGGVMVSANAATTPAPATANATILVPLSINEDLTMEFGDIAPDAAGGVVTISTAGTVTGPANFIVNTTGTIRAAQFTVTGEPTLNYVISFPNAGLETLNGPGAPMLLNNYTTSLASPVAIGGGGTSTFTVGADLTVGANQTNGAYSGNYTIQVDYQ